MDERSEGTFFSGCVNLADELFGFPLHRWWCFGKAVHWFTVKIGSQCCCNSFPRRAKQPLCSVGLCVCMFCFGSFLNTGTEICACLDFLERWLYCTEWVYNCNIININSLAEFQRKVESVKALHLVVQLKCYNSYLQNSAVDTVTARLDICFINLMYCIKNAIISKKKIDFSNNNK